jgi:hypothetical protein
VPIRALRLLDVLTEGLFARIQPGRGDPSHDPTGVYPQMDFVTCDSYRRVVRRWRGPRPDRNQRRRLPSRWRASTDLTRASGTSDTTSSAVADR